MFLFIVGSVLAGTSKTFGQLIFYRVLQGIGGGSLMPCSQAIARETFPPAEQGMAMAIYSMGVVTAPAIGPVVGGWLVDNYGWQWVFYINVPFCVVGILMVSAFVHDPAYLKRGVAAIDWGGIALLTAADVMTREVVTVAPETPVPEIAQILHAKRISGVPVVAADGGVVGIVSEGDLMRHALAIGEQRGSWWLTFFSDNSALAREYMKTHGRTARDVMTREVISIAPTALLADIAKTLERNRIKRVPVIDNGKLAGIVTRANLLQALAAANVSQAASVDDRTIRERLLAELEPQPWVHLLSKNIIVQDSVVHLWGMVATEAERDALRLAAENTPGVKKVEDHLSRYPVKIGGAS